MQQRGVILAHAERVETAVRSALTNAGADTKSVDGACRALMHASLLGIDSHGVRLTRHYVRMIRGGRINATPEYVLRATATASAMLDADHGLGHAAAFLAMEEAVRLARRAGIGAVGVVNSTHYGAAGCYALAGAEGGVFALSTTNADSAVALQDGARPFHGTNPIAAAAPIAGERPWLLDMATSSIPLNRVHLYAALGRDLATGVAAGAAGVPTTDPAAVEMLLPLGGTGYGYKGAGLAGLVTVLSAVLTGATPDPEMIAMFGEDESSRRNIGHFCLAIDPAAFAGATPFAEAMTRYVRAVRAGPAQAGRIVLAPGDREWAVAEGRQRDGIPLDPDTAAFLNLDGERPAAT